MRIQMMLVPLLLATATNAQCGLAQYAFYGQGCAGSGTGAAPCVSANWINRFSGNVGAARNFALPVAGSANGYVICSVNLFTTSNSGNATSTTFSIYDRPTPGGPPGTAIASTTMNIAGTPGSTPPGTPGVCTATFSPPVLILPNTDFFLVFDNSVNLRLPLALSGTANVHYFGGPPTWNGPFTSGPWMYQVNCCVSPGAVPVLSNTGNPQIGGNFNVDLSGAAALSLAVLFTGASDTDWNGIPLPFDLRPAGAPGCSLLAAGIFLSAVATSANGIGTQNIVLPNDPSLCGARLFQQWLVLDPTANTLGFVASNGGVARLGS